MGEPEWQACHLPSLFFQASQGGILCFQKQE